LAVALGNGLDDCPLGEDENWPYTQNFSKLVLFPDLCNREPNVNLNVLKGDDTDETDCDRWPCDNPYTHCDQRWNCRNGADELNCPDTKCCLNEHECKNSQLEFSYCIPLTHLYEKYLNPCNDSFILHQFYFYNGTNNMTENYLSWNNSKCILFEKLCRIDHHLQTSLAEDVCLYGPESPRLIDLPHVKLFQNNESLCHFSIDRFTTGIYFFKAARLGYFPSMSINSSVPIIQKTNPKKMIKSSIDGELVSYCHRGILLLTGSNQTKTCLCPPNYFGSQCQWQNQRISLTIQLLWRSSVLSSIIYQVIIMLIDENEQIADNYEQLTYMPSRDCDTKFNLYLLYPHRPKSLSKNYSIRIDLYEKVKLIYWASWYIPIPFQFLPVNRIATQLIIPETREIESCLLSCGEHGKCMRYTNNKSLFFCQCDQGYAGSQCQNKS
jgi:hypothetical protein